MKTKLLSFFSILFIALTLTSCQTREERVISKMETLSERIEKNADTFDSEDWEAVFKEYAQLQEQAAKCEFSEEQYKELGRIEAKLTAALASERAKNFGRDFGNLLNSGKEFVDGFLEGLSDAVGE